MVDVPHPQSSEEFIAVQEAALEAAGMANVKYLAEHPESLERNDIAPHYRQAATELREGIPVTPKRIDALAQLDASDPPRIMY